MPKDRHTDMFPGEVAYYLVEDKKQAAEIEFIELVVKRIKKGKRKVAPADVDMLAAMRGDWEDFA